MTAAPPTFRSTRWLRFGWPLGVFLVSRLGIALVAYLAAALLVDNPSPPPYHLRGQENLLLDVFGSRWDTGFYVSIAEEGYRLDGVPLPSVPFFPLLPLAMRAGAWLLGDAVPAGILISNLALLGATLLLYALVEASDGRSVARRAVWYFCIFPTAFFGSAIYSESLFLLGAIGSLWLARRGLWESAAMLGVLTALTRFTGILVAPMLLAEWWSQRGRTPSGASRPSALALLAPAAVPLGTLAYMLFLRLRFGDGLAFVHASAVWGRRPAGPGQLLAGLAARPTGGWSAALLAGRLPLDNALDLAFLLLFLVLGLVLLRRRRWPEACLVISGLLVSGGSGLLMSQRRYVWALFPAFIALAWWGRRPWVDRLIMALSLLLLGLFTALFAKGFWVA
ncbi:MAG: mannosyltransferase family protein [Anaerolineae bacterium]|nr:mannosyltransferase family protein [Anaerolineae bacterium]